MVSIQPLELSNLYEVHFGDNDGSGSGIGIARMNTNHPELCVSCWKIAMIDGGQSVVISIHKHRNQCIHDMAGHCGNSRRYIWRQLMRDVVAMPIRRRDDPE